MSSTGNTINSDQVAESIELPGKYLTPWPYRDSKKITMCLNMLVISLEGLYQNKFQKSHKFNFLYISYQLDIVKMLSV